MTDKVFVDTNVLVYSRDASEPPKQKQAMAWMVRLWREQTGRLSFQVLNAFCVTVTNKLQHRYKLSWWDALIVSAARVNNRRYLLTEELKENWPWGMSK